jgi:hypothetical protein
MSSSNSLIDTVLSAIAVIVSALIAAILGFYGNFRIKQLEIDTQAEKDRAEKRLRFYLPLLRYSYTLDRRIGHILTTLDTDWLAKSHLDKIKNKQGFATSPDEKGYFIISSVYIFACFFGWSEAIKKGVDATRPFSEKSRLRELLSKARRKVFAYLKIPEKKNVFLFDPDISMVSKLFQYEELFNEYLVSKTIVNPRDASKLHKQFQYSIGELMLEKESEESYRCKSFREFFDAYLNDEKFRFWFVPLENVFIDLCNFEKGKDLETQIHLKNDVRPLRLLAIRYWCRVLMKNMSDQLDIETKPPDEVLDGVSTRLQKTIKSIELERLESYLLGVRINHE